MVLIWINDVTINCMKKDNSRHKNLYKKLGQNIKYKRSLLEISQEELAFRISSTRNYIGCIERAEKYPSLAVIFDIAKALSCNPKDLFDNF